MDARFKISVSAQDACGNEVVLFDGAFDLGLKGAAVSDAGRTPIGYELKAELIEIFL